MFVSIDAAARGLLVTTCEALNAREITYVVAGGWVPLLRGGASGLCHPGTRDVDVLFRDKDGVREATGALLNEGLVYSGKYEFQMMLPVAVSDQEFIFNVDLMYQDEQQPELYADIFQLGVLDAYDPTGKRWVKSIAFPSAGIVFEQALWSNIRENGPDVSGSRRETLIPLLDEAALILSKMSSVRNDKRTRDAFDIYYVLFGPQQTSICDTLRELRGLYPDLNFQINNFAGWVLANSARFDRNVARHAQKPIEHAGRDTARLLQETRLEHTK
jgi:hypothetical protein